MKQKSQGLIAGVLIGATLTSGVVFATKGTKTIDVLYNNIKVYKDNVLCELKDANGTVIEPFIYNGTTYMPVRGTASLADMEVTWDGATQSVYLWDEIPAGETILMDVCPPYDGVGMQVGDFEMAGENYNGFYIGYISSNCNALINLNGKYSSIKMTVGPVDGNVVCRYPAMLNFYLDSKKVKTIEIKEDEYPTEIYIPLNGALQLKIENELKNHAPAPIGFGNITLQ